jgi:hypothetical protein
MKTILFAIAAVAALSEAAFAQDQVEQFRRSGVTLRQSTYQGAPAFELTMPPTSYQDPRREKLSDRNFMAWLPLDFGDGTIEVEVASDLAADAPDYARGFVGLAYRIDAKGRFENIYLRPTNSTAPDQVRRNHTIQYAAYPDFRFDMLRAQSPEKYETYADISTGRWIHMRLVVKGPTAQLFLDRSSRPAFIVNDMKLPSGQRGGVGIWIESGTIAHFRNLRVTPKR